MKSSQVKRQLLKNKAVADAYKEVVVTQEIAEKIIKARAAKGLSQAQLALQVGTKQPSIARLESGDYLPSLTFLSKVAEQLDLRLNTQILLDNQQPMAAWELARSVQKKLFNITTEKGINRYATRS